MQGRTKGFYEDILVLAVIVLVGWGGYTFFFTENSIEPSPMTTSYVEPKYTQPSKQVTADIVRDKTETVEKTPLTVEKEEIKLVKKNLQDVTEIIKKEEKQKQPLQKDPENIQLVDMKKLQKFLIATKRKIKNVIQLEENNNHVEKLLSIRVTVLKNGHFEQLIYTSGDKSIFKNNYKNIINLFPLKIDKDIAGEFPRYLRYSFKFSKKEE